MDRYKLILFDFDGTLAATHEAITFCVKKAFSQFGGRVPSESDIRATIGLSLEDTFRTLAPTLTGSERVLEWINFYRELYQAEGERRTYLYEGTKKSLQSIVESGASLVVVSNKGEQAINATLERLGIKELMSLVIGARKGTKKPSDMIFCSAILPVFPRISTDQVLVVGDTVTDLLFARNIRAASCWASYGYGDRKSCLAMNPAYTIRDIYGLVSIDAPG